jgi:hypothetical protein
MMKRRKAVTHVQPVEAELAVYPGKYAKPDNGF